MSTIGCQLCPANFEVAIVTHSQGIIRLICMLTLCNCPCKLPILLALILKWLIQHLIFNFFWFQVNCNFKCHWRALWFFRNGRLGLLLFPQRIHLIKYIIFNIVILFIHPFRINFKVKELCMIVFLAS